MRSIAFALVLAFAALIAAPAAARTPKTVPAEAQQRIRAIGVVSAIGDEVDVVHFGFTVFGNTESWLPIADWGMDDLAFKQVESQLAPRYVLRRLEAGPDWYARPHRGWGGADPGKQLKARVAALPKTGLDAVLVIDKSMGRDDMGSVETLTGLSTFERHLFGQPFAFYRLSVWDAATGEPLAVRYGRPEPSKLAWLGLPGTGKTIYDWPDTAEEATEEEKSVMRFTLSKELKRGLARDLFEIGLGTPVPAGE